MHPLKHTGHFCIIDASQVAQWIIFPRSLRVYVVFEFGGEGNHLLDNVLDFRDLMTLNSQKLPLGLNILFE